MDASTNSNQSGQKQPGNILDALAAPKEQSLTESGQLGFFPEDPELSRPSGTLSWLARYLRLNRSVSWRLSSEDFERNVRRSIEQHAPFSTLSNVLLFNAELARLSIDSDEQPAHSIFACEMDHLLHQRLNDVDVLIVVECKNQPVIVEADEHWLVHYVRRNNPITGRITRNVQYQLQRQAEGVHLDTVLNIQGVTVPHRQKVNVTCHEPRPKALANTGRCRA